MSSEPRLYRIDPSRNTAEPVTEVDFSEAGFQERRDIQEWVAEHPRILGEDLLIVAKEYSGFDRTRERPDLVAVDKDGKLVIVELKRDDTGANVHWQAIKYASYFKRAKPEHIAEMLARHAQISEAEAMSRLRQHIYSDDLEDLNRDQRIILVSHRFAPEVTSAVMWLNEKFSSQDPITCMKLTPYRDPDTGALYVQSSILLPVPGTEGLDVTIGEGEATGRDRRAGPVKKEDNITHFLRGLAARAIDSLSEDELKPDKTSRWAGVEPNYRYYHLWYSQPPWGKWVMDYHVNLYESSGEEPASLWVGLVCDKKHITDREGFSEKALDSLKSSVLDLTFHSEQKTYDRPTWFGFGVSTSVDALEDSIQESTGILLGRMIESATPIVREFARRQNEE